MSTPLSSSSCLRSSAPIAACSGLAGEMAAAEDGWHHYAHIPASDFALCNIKGLFINYFYTAQHLGHAIQDWLIRGER